MAVKTVPHCRVAVRDTLTMKWIVLPSDTTDRQVIAIKDCEAISIDLDAMMNPIPMVPATEWREDRHNDVVANESRE